MNEENARRLARRQVADLPLISEGEVVAYRRIHYPDRRADRPRCESIPDNSYVAKLSHVRFHEWFGTVCDDTCPHAKRGFTLRQPSWWRRLFG